MSVSGKDDLAKPNLPVQPAVFVGREGALEEIQALLADTACRLLTLTGTGGIGKTRLAIEAARRAQDAFPDGVYFVALQPLLSPDLIVPTLANTINCQFYPGSETKQQLLDFLGEKQILLVMDNFEHLLEGVGLVSELLAYVPALKIIATSREALNLQEEWLYPVRGMRIPRDTSTTDFEEYSAVKLFVQSARRMQANFPVSDEQAGIARICRLVEGMPLGLELAAAWVRTLSCNTIADEIEHSLDILETASRNFPERHRNMRAVLDHSWRLLTESEQDVFKRLTLFRGGFTREAAQAVAGASLKMLSTLVDKSLLQRDTFERYDIHELLRQYGEEHLQASAEQSHQAHDQHCAYFTALLHQREEDLKGRRQLKALDEIEADFENIRAAWLWAIQQQNDEALHRSLQGLYLFCEARSRFQEGSDFFWQAEQSLPYDHAPLTWSRLRARRMRLQVQGYLKPDVDFSAEIENSLAIAHQHHDLAEMAFCWWTLGEVYFTARDYGQALSFYEQSLAAYRDLNDRIYIARTFQRIGLCYGNTGRFEEFRRLAREGHQLSSDIGDIIGTANCLYNLASAAGLTGNLREDEEYLNQVLTLRREIGDRSTIAFTMTALAIVALFTGDMEKARVRASEALTIALNIHHIDTKIFALSALGLITAIEGDYQHAYQLSKESQSVGINPLRIGLTEGSLCIAAYGLNDYQAARHHFHSLMQQMSILRVVSPAKFAMAIGTIIAVQAGEHEQAVEWLAYASTEPSSQLPWMEKWPLLMHLQATLREELGPERFAAAWERGKVLDFEAVLATLPQETQIEEDQSAIGNQPLLEPLTERELEVLHLIAAGMTNREIAEKLILAVGTVKWYVSEICSKLHAQNRVQALAHARELNLLP